jgi:LuxR family maltose regulon positive regulatory protein
MARGDWASGKVQAVYTLVALFQGKIECATESIERARASLTDEDGFWYSVTQWFWGLLHLSDQDVRREDAQPLMRLIQPHMESQNVLLVVMGLCNLGELRLKQGRLRDAETLFNQALSRAVDAHDQPLPIAGEPMIWLGDLARERNELARAEQYLTEGIALISDWGRIAAFDGYLALARLRLAQGEIAAAYKVMDRANQLAVTFDATEMDDYMVAMARARMAALEGDFDTVARWVDSRGLDALDPGNLQLDETVPLHLRKYELIVLGLARILEARPDEALVLLEPLFDFVTAKGRWGLGIESLALQAIAYHMTGDVEQALACLDRALTRAEPEGYVRLFLDLGEPMAHLLYEAVRRGLYPDYAGRLLAAFPDTGAPASEPRVENNLVEPLSERELEVLGGIAEGLTNQEIAQRLYISERTVKWHAGNIYSKLQVSNRTEATARARKLGILPR